MLGKPSLPFTEFQPNVDLKQSIMWHPLSLIWQGLTWMSHANLGMTKDGICQGTSWLKRVPVKRMSFPRASLLSRRLKVATPCPRLWYSRACTILDVSGPTVYLAGWTWGGFWRWDEWNRLSLSCAHRSLLCLLLLEFFGCCQLFLHPYNIDVIFGGLLIIRNKEGSALVGGYGVAHMWCVLILGA